MPLIIRKMTMARMKKAAGKDGDDRHDDIVRESIDQILEYTADENADCHVEQVALQSELLKFFDDPTLFLFFFCHGRSSLY